MVRISQTWYQKMRKTWKKKVMKRHVAICGGREAVADFVQRGVKWPPPPPPPQLRYGTAKKKRPGYLVGNLVATNWPIEKALHAIGYNQIPTK